MIEFTIATTNNFTKEMVLNYANLVKVLFGKEINN